MASQGGIHRWLAALALVAGSSLCHAVGLGPINVLSGLGHPFHATIPLQEALAEGNYCIKATLRSLDGTLVANARAGVQQSKRAPVLHLTTRESLSEPALGISVSVGCGTIAFQRDYQILLDPVLSLPTISNQADSAPRRAARAVAPPRITNLPPQGAEPAPARVATRKKRMRERELGIERAAGEELVEDSSRKVKPAQPKRAREAAAPRNVLKLGALSSATGPAAGAPGGIEATPEIQALLDPNAPLSLRRADTLSVPATPPDAQRLAELREEQARFSALLRDEDPAQAAFKQVQKLQTDVEAMRVEAVRAAQQQQSDRAAFQVALKESHRWIAGLGAVLLVCVLSLGWLSWRLAAARNEEARAHWRALVAERRTDGSPPPREPTVASTAETDAMFPPPQQAAPEPGSDPEFEDEAEDQHYVTGSTGRVGTAEAAAPPEQKSGGEEAPLKQEPAPVAESEAPAQTQAQAQPVQQAGGTPAGQGVAPDGEQGARAVEISDVMELAQAWMALNDPQKVLDLLDPYSEIENPESPLPWLCLLEVYRTLGNQEKHDAIYKRVTKLFNVRVAPWDAEHDGEPPKTLADYPHIGARIYALWESDEVVPYLQDLQRDNRHGTRNGFDLPVYRDLMKLVTLAEGSDLSQRREIMNEIAYPILFPRPEHTETAAATAEPAASPAGARSEPKPQLRVRPKYITTSYQGKVLTERERGAPEPAAAPAANAEAARAPSPAEPQTAGGRWPVLPGKHKPAAAGVAQPVRSGAAASAAAPAHAVASHARPAAKQAAAAATQTHPAADAVHEDSSPMGIKLHLAVAYQDIGDLEGALLLLDEVIKDGNAQQAEQARKMRTRMRG
jgi:pilus assembly protein FimV